jgi:hypothetical protein
MMPLNGHNFVLSQAADDLRIDLFEGRPEVGVAILIRGVERPWGRGGRRGEPVGKQR